MTRVIRIITDREDGLPGHYLISKLAWHWRRAGYQLRVGPAEAIRSDEDVAILHVDRTRIDPSQLPGNPPGRPFLNGKILDISKRLFSGIRVMPGDPWEGPVIVKSNLNYYGELEWRERSHGFVERKRRWLAKRHWKLARMLPPGTYPVLPCLQDVPGWVWRDPEILVERFMPEREAGLYCLRSWVFFGNREYTFRLFSTETIIKAKSIVDHEFLGAPPQELVEFRQRHQWDFGKFDYVVVEGRPILLDTNKTPAIVTGPDTPRLKDLAGGIEAYVGGSL